MEKGAKGAWKNEKVPKCPKPVPLPEHEDHGEVGFTCVKLMGLSLVMQSAYLQANIPQSLPFICCGISYNKRTQTQASFPEEPDPRCQLGEARSLSQMSPNEAWVGECPRE